MKLSTAPTSQYKLLLITGLFLTSFFAHASASDSDKSLAIESSSFVKHKVTKNLRMRGWKVSSNMYVGQTKVLGNWGLGLIVDNRSYAYGFNQDGFSIAKKF